jgi:rRNA-processing protein FCF1
MKDYYNDVIQKYRRSGILLDTNILLLYLIGTFDIGLIRKFKRTANKFVTEDYITLSIILGYFTTVATTPNILTEVSNLSGQLATDLKPGCFARFAFMINYFEEHYIKSIDIAAQGEFQHFGLADTSIISLVTGRYLVLTEDFRLAQYLQNKGADVLNFNHIRTINW